MVCSTSVLDYYQATAWCCRISDSTIPVCHRINAGIPLAVGRAYDRMTAVPRDDGVTLGSDHSNHCGATHTGPDSNQRATRSSARSIHCPSPEVRLLPLGRGGCGGLLLRVGQ